jgi:hypothetical protein
MEHYDILIATPGATLEAQYVKSLVATLTECDKRGITYKWLNAYSSLVHHARELTISGGEGMSLNPNDKGPLGDTVTYKKVFCIDSDIEWTTEQFFKLYETEQEIVSGAYLLANGVTSSVHTVEYPQGVPIDAVLKMNKIVEVAGVGFGFIAVSSGVFEKLNRPWFKHFEQTIQKDDGSFIQDSIGEDISWCVNAQRKGLKVYFDPSVLVNHLKKTRIVWK